MEASVCVKDYEPTCAKGNFIYALVNMNTSITDLIAKNTEVKLWKYDE